MKPKFRSLIAAFAPLSRSSLIVCASLCAATSAHATDGSWTGATDATWAGDNWTSTPSPGTGETATFNGAGNGNTTINVSGVSIKSILFRSANAAAYTLGTSGSEILTLDDTGLLSVGSTVVNSQTVAANLVLGTATASTYSLLNNGAGSLTISGNIQGGTGGTAAAKTLTIGGSGNSLVSSVIDKGGATSLGLAKTGTGTLTLTNANTYNGATTVNGGGTLKLDFAAIGAPATNIVSATSALNLTGGNLVVNGASAPGSSQAFASGAFGAGWSNLSAAPDSGANLPAVSLGALTFSVGSSLKFTGPVTMDGAGVVAATSEITTNTAGIGSKGLLGGIALGGTGAYATVGLYDWPSTSLADGTAGTAPYTIKGGSAVLGFYQTTGITTGGNYDYNSAGVNAIGNAGGATTVRFHTPGGTNTITNSSFTFQNMQGILVTPNMGANNARIAATGSGALSFRRATGSGLSYGVLWQNNPLGYLRMDIPLSAGRQAGQANGLVQAGPGTVTYAANSSYELQTYLNGGFSLITGNGAFGNQTTASIVNLSGGTIVGDATFAMDNAGANKRTINLLSGGGGLAATGSNVYSVTGVVSGAAGSGPLVIGIPAVPANGNVVGLLPGSGAGTANVTDVNATGTVALTAPNTYFGGTSLVSGVLNINGINALGGANYGGVTFKGGTLQYATNFAGNGSGDLTSIGTAGITFTAAGGSIDTNGNDVTYAGSIGNGSAGGFTKIGLGTLTLGGANDYSGTTTISGGTLNVTNTSGSATGSGNVALNGGTLAGSGIIGGSVTQAGGTLAPGAAGTTLTVSTLNHNSGTLNFTLDGSGPGNSKVNVTNATFTATPVISFNGAASVSNGQNFTVLSSTNAITGAGFLGSIAPTVIGRITLAPALVGNDIVVNISGEAGNLVWAGGVPGLGGSITGDTTTWNNTQSPGVAGNWNNAGNRDYFFDGDSVTFNDAGTPNYSVNLTTINSPSSVVVDSTGNYQFTGVGSIAGATSLAKSGSGNLTVSTANTYTGGTTISAGSLTLGAADALPTTGAVVVQGSGTLNLAGFSQNLGSLSDGGVGTGTITSSGSANLSANLSINSAASTTFSGTISGSVGLTKSGIGSVLLSGTNTFTGGVNIDGGSITIGSAGALNSTNPNAVAFGANSTGKLQLNGISTAVSSLTTSSPVGTPIVENANISPATLTVDNASDGTFAGVLQNGTGDGALSLVKQGAGILTLSGLNSFTGTTKIEEGSITLGASLALQGSTLDYSTTPPSGSLSFGTLTAATLGGLQGNKDLVLQNSTPAAVALTVGGNGLDTTYSGILSGPGSLIKAGGGILTLSGANSYAGSTTVNAGKLLLTTDGVISGTTLNFGTAGGTLFEVGGGTFSGTTSTVPAGIPGFLLSGGSATFSGTLAAQDSASGSFALIRVSGGDLNAPAITIGRSSGAVTSEPAAGATNSGLVIDESGAGPTTVDISGNLSISGSNSTANYRMDAGSVNVGGVVTVGLNNTGRWSVMDINGGTFNSTNTATGVQIGNGQTGNAIFIVQDGGVANVDKFTFNAAGSGTFGYTGMVKLAGSTSKLYVGAGGMVRTGTFELCTSVLNLFGGTLGASASWSSNVAVTVGGPATIKAADANDVPFNITMNGALTGAGSLIKEGNGTLKLNGGNSYTGDTEINAGTLSVATGTFDDAATITINSGTLNLNFSGGDRVAALVVGGTPVGPGVYGSQTNTIPGIIQIPEITGSGMIYIDQVVPEAPYTTWINGFSFDPGADTTPAGDPDGDGLSNQQEYAFGLIPNSGSSVNPITAQLDKTTGLFTYTRRKPSITGMHYVYQYSTTLDSWTTFTPDGTTTNSGDPVEAVTVDVPNALLTNGKLFVRVTAE